MADLQQIHTLGTPFDFDKITLTTPTVVQGGSAHFTKLMHGDEALYVQTPTCETRQGMVVNGRKAYYDIILDPNTGSSKISAENAAFLEWVECLEDRIIRSLHEHGKVWFRDPLSEDDIRNLFTSPMKPFKGGKQFSIRINVLPGKARTNQFNCTVFDESENSVQVDYINATHHIISIVEVLGIRFTSSSFQLELASKQIAVIVQKPVFQTCIIKKDLGFSAIINNTTNAKRIGSDTDTVLAHVADTTPISPPDISISSVDDIRVDSAASSIKIKDPLEVYYTLYKAARKRAHEAKQVAIAAYLDAKNIKNTYNLKLVEDDSDDNDVDDDDDADDSDDDAIGNSDNNSVNSDSGDDNDSDAGEDDDGDDDDDDCNDFKKRPPINISGDSIHLSISDYDALG